MKRLLMRLHSVATVRRHVSSLFCLSLCALPFLVHSAPANPNPAGPVNTAPSLQTNQIRSVSDSVAGDMEVAALANALTNRMQEVAAKTAVVESTFKRNQTILITFTALVILMVLILRFGRRFMA